MRVRERPLCGQPAFLGLLQREAFSPTCNNTQRGRNLARYQPDAGNARTRQLIAIGGSKGNARAVRWGHWVTAGKGHQTRNPYSDVPGRLAIEHLLRPPSGGQSVTTPQRRADVFLQAQDRAETCKRHGAWAAAAVSRKIGTSAVASGGSLRENSQTGFTLAGRPKRQWRRPLSYSEARGRSGMAVGSVGNSSPRCSVVAK